MHRSRDAAPTRLKIFKSPPALPFSKVGKSNLENNNLRCKIREINTQRYAWGKATQRSYGVRKKMERAILEIP